MKSIRKAILLSVMTVGALSAGGMAQARDLTIALATEPSSMDPQFHSLTPNIQFSETIFDPLVRTDAAACWPTGPAAGVSGWVGAEPPAQVTPDWGLVAPLAATLPDGSPGAARIVTVAADADPDVVTAIVRSWD